MNGQPRPYFLFDIWAQLSGEMMVIQYRLDEVPNIDSMIADHWFIKLFPTVLRTELFVIDLLHQFIGLLWWWN